MWPNPQEVADLVKFTEEILNGKFHFLCIQNPILIQTKTINKALNVKQTVLYFFHYIFSRWPNYLENFTIQNGILESARKCFSEKTLLRLYFVNETGGNVQH